MPSIWFWRNKSWHWIWCNGQYCHKIKHLNFKIKPIWQLPVPTERNNNKKNRTNSSKEEKKMWQLNFGVCAFILIIFVFGRGGSSRQGFKCWLEQYFFLWNVSRESLTEIQIQAYCNLFAWCNIWSGRFVQDGVVQM